jgi:hypothetical protein
MKGRVFGEFHAVGRLRPWLVFPDAERQCATCDATWDAIWTFGARAEYHLDLHGAAAADDTGHPCTVVRR